MTKRIISVGLTAAVLMGAAAGIRRVQPPNDVEAPSGPSRLDIERMAAAQARRARRAAKRRAMIAATSPSQSHES